MMNNIFPFTVTYKRHATAKSMKLRYNAATDSAVVTMPNSSSERAALKFAKQNLTWLLEQRQTTEPQKFLLPGYIIPYKGQDHIIFHQPDHGGRVHIENHEILVGGLLHGFPVRLENHLKKQARSAIEPLADHMASIIGKNFKRIQIRDTKSRWGSCSSTGNLSFSWRLIMTPPAILEYVVAHEVAHLQEMNHSVSFWNVVNNLVDNAKLSRKWLKSEGQKLMLINNVVPKP